MVLRWLTVSNPSAPASPFSHAFDRESAGYAAGWDQSPLVMQFRARTLAAFVQALPPPARVVDLGCGTGVDAALLGALGYDVTGFDLSPNMVALAIERGVRAELGSIESLGALSLVDAVWSNFGALNCMDPSQVGRVLARLIRPGGVFLAVCISPRCPIEELALAAKFRWPLRRGAQTAVRGILVPMRYPRVVDWKQLLSPAFQLIRVQALGVVVPPPDLGGSVGRASAVDAAVGRVPILRHFGDHTLSLWRRRG